MLRNTLILLTMLPFLAACAAPAATQRGSRTPLPSTAIPPQQAPAIPATGFRAPQIMSGPGLNAVIGANTEALIRQFGTPRLDVWENDARKLQFSGTRCVLDIYLYPTRPGATETATWVEARRSDGRDVDRAACIAAMRR